MPHRRRLALTLTLTHDGLRAAGARGSKGGRRPAAAATKTGDVRDVRTAHLEGRSIAARFSRVRPRGGSPAPPAR